ncbi:unnamed protein product [Vitrella brassicaformis CCMP3155]|uniref:Intraflagellar transport protein 74 homolog n=1 Tax=Vitrella brassicaformis (strain CCMP3155) TaxID=1169540 RepID=A0A0G4EZB0_VITBC|nr:unnamed protein product [Vitrella brassicaformis CCMP3155]|eukprot:CEM04647.1 unnamed protein product [Vitrella brassicaformis CCMP3155]
MQRPSSRGYGPTPPSRMGIAAPPGTGVTRPITGSLGYGGVPGTAMRGRMGTAMRDGAIGVGVATEVKVADRPVTQQGLMGMKTGQIGPGRQVYDRSYYMTQLRQKTGELMNEINRFRQEIDTIQNDTSLFQQYERRYDELIKKVRTLEGDLADYNLALDKQRHDTRPEEVQHMFKVLKTQNDQQRAILDSIFLEKKQNEEQIASVEDEIEKVRKASEERLNELHPDQREQYEGFQNENETLLQEVRAHRAELDDVTRRLADVEARLRSDAYRLKFQQLREAASELQERKGELEKLTAHTRLSIPEQRELLKTKVRDDNAVIVQSEQQVGEVRADIDRYRRQLQELEEEGKHMKENEHEKYQLLFRKDQEMTTFMANYESARQAEEEHIQAKQSRVVSLLESITRSCERQAAMPTSDRVKDMTEELDFKSEQLGNAQTTHVRLQGELQKRHEELQKITTLDEKIAAELQSLEERRQFMTQEMAGKLSDVDRVREDGRREKIELEERRERLYGRRDVLKQQVNFVKINLDSKRQLLADHETHQALETQEQKLKHFEQNLYHLRTFIHSKTAESDFEQQRKACTQLVEQLNQLMVKAQTTSAMGPLSGPTSMGLNIGGGVNTMTIR